MNTSGKILIVDDDAEIREIVHVLLESEGFDPVEASNGETVLSLLSEEIDLVILDVMMEGLSGYQVCRKIRETSNVPILFLTAKKRIQISPWASPSAVTIIWQSRFPMRSCWLG